MQKLQKIEVSPKTIIFTVCFIIFVYFLWFIKDLIFSLFIAFILMSALRPPVLWLEKKRVPRTAAALLVFIAFIVFFLFLISLIIPPIVNEIGNLITNFPTIMRHINPQINGWFKIDSLLQFIPTVTSNVLMVTSNVLNIFQGLASNAFFVVSTLFFGFYFLMQENVFKNLMEKFLEEPQIEQYRGILLKIERRMSAWFWGEFILMAAVGVLTFIGLNLIGMKYALAFAVLAGLLEVVPNVGPIIAAIIPIFIAFAYSPVLCVETLALYIVVQQLENNLIVPVIMKNAVGLNPIITLMALVIGGRIGGTLGFVLAIPAYLFFEVMVMEYFTKRKAAKAAENVRK